MIPVFVDSSVLIAASMSARGFANDLMMLGVDGSVSLFVSDVVLMETERNLHRKAPHVLPVLAFFQQVLAPEIVDPRDALVLEAARIVHPKDAPIIAAAVEAHAKWLATYDRKHLLPQRDSVVDRYGGVIATPDEIVRSVMLINQ